jgi:hypothetical protein
MNSSPKANFLKTIQATLPGFGRKGALLFDKDVDPLLRGIFIDSSRDPKRLYVQVFVQPLYLPGSTFLFNMGWRLGGRAWIIDDHTVSDDLVAAISSQALPFLSSVKTPLDLAGAVIRTPFLAQTSPEGQAPTRINDPVCVRMRLYSLIYAEKSADAFAEFEKLKNLLTLQFEWENAILQEAASILELSSHYPDQAVRKMEEWKIETMRILRLDTLVRKAR